MMIENNRKNEVARVFAVARWSFLAVPSPLFARQRTRRRRFRAARVCGVGFDGDIFGPTLARPIGHENCAISDIVEKQRSGRAKLARGRARTARDRAGLAG
ncbi:hypothetical protein [Brevundimonas sp.]|uniref:hypothetical protein n=1 Tax=Brevundimonas sp. TaxID=1871086 RepID=UPI0037C03F56